MSLTTDDVIFLQMTIIFEWLATSSSVLIIIHINNISRTSIIRLIILGELHKSVECSSFICLNLLGGICGIEWHISYAQ